jgi:tungstate transport system substrate-binding protein
VKVAAWHIRDGCEHAQDLAIAMIARDPDVVPTGVVRRLSCVLVALAVFAACHGTTPPVIVATTTSVANSGLLDVILPSFETPVRVLQVGSGRALALLASGGAGVAITHAPAQETDALRNYSGWFYRKILYNDFLIVGPADDPAGIAALADPIDAMRRIIESRQRFISRGDESGTHERERQFWTAAGINPAHAQIVVAGAGMGQTLRIASEANGYTLTDRGTFQALSNSLRLRELVAGDARLLNTYAVIADPSNEGGIRFAKWLSEGEGRRVLTDALSKRTVKGFTLWPADHDGTRPDARPF